MEKGSSQNVEDQLDLATTTGLACTPRRRVVLAPLVPHSDGSRGGRTNVTSDFSGPPGKGGFIWERDIAAEMRQGCVS